MCYEVGEGIEDLLLGMDAVDGWLDLFEFPRLPGPRELLSIETRNFLPPSLTEARAEELLREKVLRLIFQQGFFKLHQPGLAILREPVALHLPYWLGLYGARGAVRWRVIDALRRRVEGAKASAFF